MKHVYRIALASSVLSLVAASGVQASQSPRTHPSDTGSVLIVCGLADATAKPYLRFIVRQNAGDTNAAITYVKSASIHSEEVQVERPIPGCESASTYRTEISGQSIYVECAADGDAGFLSAELQDDSLEFVGTMNFPNSGVEGLDDSSVAVHCAKN